MTLRADCSSCFGLCCVALAFTRSADFPIDKRADDPCVNLDEDYSCRVHAELRPLGFKGCTAFDCLGAGQKVSQQTYGGRSWRHDPSTASSMFAAFASVRSLHELLWYLDQAIALATDAGRRAELVERFDRIRALSDQDGDRLQTLDVHAEYDAVRPLLIRTSELARAGHGGGAPRFGPGQDLSGARLAGADLSGETLRGGLLIGADLSGARLSRCDVLGVDLRDADVSGADLGGAIFLTPMQVHHAHGDAATVLPPGFERPAHW